MCISVCVCSYYLLWPICVWFKNVSCTIQITMKTEGCKMCRFYHGLMETVAVHSRQNECQTMLVRMHKCTNINQVKDI